MSSQRKILHRIWHIELKEWFASWMGEQQYCERCNKYGAMVYDMAHRKVRYYINTIEEYFMALHLCRECHNWQGRGTHEEQYNKFMQILEDCRERKYGNIQ